MLKLREGTVLAWMVLAAGGGISAQAEETVSKHTDLAVSGAPWIMVQTEGGSIELRAGGDGTVRIDEKRRAPTKEEAEAMKVTAAFDHGVVRVVYQSDHKPNRSVSFVIQAPAACRLQLVTSGGAIDVDGFTGGVAAKTSGGAINGRNLRGEANLKTSGGGIRVDGIDGIVDARTSGGPVTISGMLHGANTAASSGGSVTVSVSDKSKLNVEGATLGGSATNDFGLPVSNGHFAGKIGDGSSGSLNLHTSGGSVTLRKL